MSKQPTPMSDLAEYVAAVLELEEVTGEKLSNADVAASIAEIWCAQGRISTDEVEVNQAIHEIEQQLPYYTGRNK